MKENRALDLVKVAERSRSIRGTPNLKIACLFENS